MRTNTSNVVAILAPEETGECRGLAMMICPACDKRIRETDLERYFEKDSQNKVELCTSCREEFESDNDLSLDSDTLDCDVYGKLLAFSLAAATRLVAEQQGLNELTAPIYVC